MQRRRVLIPFALVLALTVLASGAALGKGHVPTSEVQVAHRGIVKQLPLQAGPGHLAHGDFYLPACDNNNVFSAGDDVSGISDSDGDGRADQAGGLNAPDPVVTAACPPGTF